MMRRLCCLVSCISFLSPLTVFSICPDYTHRNSIIGNPADLPAGWYAFAYSTRQPEPRKNNIYISDIKEYNPKPVIVGNDEIIQYGINSMEIDEGGEWILFMAQRWDGSTPWHESFLVKKDGTGLTKVPFVANMKPKTVSLYRRSPLGTEITYIPLHSRIMRALKVDLTGNKPVFGNDRKIADLAGSPYTWCNEGIGCKDTRANKDQIFGRIDERGLARTGFITIPDSGKGVAGPSNVYKFKDDPADDKDNADWWGSCHNMSWDGTLAIANVGWMGDGCVPGHRYRNAQMPVSASHKGFVITPFRRDTDPALTIVEHVNADGISINWCPENYWIGQWDESEFINWQFGQSNDYVIGVSRGPKAPSVGIWTVEWKTNTWTQLTPAGNNLYEYDLTALFFEGNPQTGVPGKGRLHLKENVAYSRTDVRLFSVCGSTVSVAKPGVKIEMMTSRNGLVSVRKSMFIH